MMARVVLEYSEPLSNDSCHADSSDEDVPGPLADRFFGDSNIVEGSIGEREVSCLRDPRQEGESERTLGAGAPEATRVCG